MARPARGAEGVCGPGAWSVFVGESVALRRCDDQGDVQMCAMLALVAPEELRLDLGRTIQFVETYVGE